MDYKIRPWIREDYVSLTKYANNLNIARFMTDGFPHPYTIDDANEFIEFANKGKPVHIFAIDINGEAVGGIGIHPQSGIHKKNAELGYWLGEQFWGQGIVTSAIQHVLEFAFKTYDINRVFARPFGINIASQKVLKKAGFKLEAIFEKTLFKNGEYLDELVYAKTR